VSFSVADVGQCVQGSMVEQRPDGSISVTTDFNQLLSQFDHVRAPHIVMFPLRFH
jgi:hypothetical protein